MAVNRGIVLTLLYLKCHLWMVPLNVTQGQSNDCSGRLIRWGTFKRHLYLLKYPDQIGKGQKAACMYSFTSMYSHRLHTVPSYSWLKSWSLVANVSELGFSDIWQPWTCRQTVCSGLWLVYHRKVKFCSISAVTGSPAGCMVQVVFSLPLNVEVRTGPLCALESWEKSIWNLRVDWQVRSAVPESHECGWRFCLFSWWLATSTAIWERNLHSLTAEECSSQLRADKKFFQFSVLQFCL